MPSVVMATNSNQPANLADHTCPSPVRHLQGSPAPPSPVRHLQGSPAPPSPVRRQANGGGGGSPAPPCSRRGSNSSANSGGSMYSPLPLLRPLRTLHMPNLHLSSPAACTPDSGIQGSLGSGIQGSLGSGIQGSLGSGIQGSLGLIPNSHHLQSNCGSPTPSPEDLPVPDTIVMPSETLKHAHSITPSSGRSSLDCSVRNSVASSESSNYSLVSANSEEHPTLVSNQHRKLATLAGSCMSSSAVGANGVCVLCNNKCPLLDPHPWRRACVACGCSSAGHMAQSAQMNRVVAHLFNDSTAAVNNKNSISSLSDADSGCCFVFEEYAWVPIGLSPKQVQQYFSGLYPYKVPYINSPGEQYRACQLVTQLPAHDILPRGGALRDDAANEQFRRFSSERRRDALGRGVVTQLPMDIIAATCAKCQTVIHGGEMAVTAARAAGKLWHPGCFVCGTCEELLVDLIYFTKDQQLFCGRHHADQIRHRCAACDEIIFSGDFTECGGRHWHSGHFCCSECEAPLAGGKYVMQGDLPYCPGCYDSLFAYMCAFCNHIIGAEDTQVTYQEQHWHANRSCFNCATCHKSLVGLPFLPKGGIIFCSIACKNGTAHQPTVHQPTVHQPAAAHQPDISFSDLKTSFTPLTPIVKPTFTGLQPRNGVRPYNYTPPRTAAAHKDEDYDSAVSSCHSTLDSPMSGSVASGGSVSGSVSGNSTLDKPPPPLPPKPSFMRGSSHLGSISEQTQVVDVHQERLESVIEDINELNFEQAVECLDRENVYIECDSQLTSPTSPKPSRRSRRSRDLERRLSDTNLPPLSLPDLTPKSILKDEPPAGQSSSQSDAKSLILSSSAKNVSFNPRIAERARSNSLTRSSEVDEELAGNGGAYSDSEDAQFSKHRAGNLRHRRDLLKAVANSFTKEELAEYLGHKHSSRRRVPKVDGLRQRIDYYSDSSSSSSDDDEYWCPPTRTRTGTAQNIYSNQIYRTTNPHRTTNPQRRRHKKSKCKIS